MISQHHKRRTTAPPASALPPPLCIKLRVQEERTTAALKTVQHIVDQYPAAHTTIESLAFNDGAVDIVVAAHPTAGIRWDKPPAESAHHLETLYFVTRDLIADLCDTDVCFVERPNETERARTKDLLAHVIDVTAREAI